MASLRITLPDDLQRHVDARVSAAGFSDQAAYLRALVEHDREHHRREVARVKALIEEGLASGVDPRSVDEIFAELIAEDPDLRD